MKVYFSAAGQYYTNVKFGLTWTLKIEGNVTHFIILFAKLPLKVIDYKYVDRTYSSQSSMCFRFPRNRHSNITFLWNILSIGLCQTNSDLSMSFTFKISTKHIFLMRGFDELSRELAKSFFLFVLVLIQHFDNLTFLSCVFCYFVKFV